MAHAAHVPHYMVRGVFYPIDSWMISLLERLDDHGRTIISLKFRTCGARDPISASRYSYREAFPKREFSASVLFAGKLSSQMPNENLLLHQSGPFSGESLPYLL